MANKYVDGTPYASLVRDLSTSGLRLFTPIEPSHHSQANVILEVGLNEMGRPLCLDARLSRTAENGDVAFEFINLKPSLENRLRAFIEGQSSSYREAKGCFNG